MSLTFAAVRRRAVGDMHAGNSIIADRGEVSLHGLHTLKMTHIVVADVCVAYIDAHHGALAVELINYALELTKTPVFVLALSIWGVSHHVLESNLDMRNRLQKATHFVDNTGDGPFNIGI